MMRFMALALIVGAAHAACGPEGCSSNSLNETRAEIAKVISGLGDLPAPREQLTFRSSLKTTTAKGSPGVSQEALLAAVSEAVSAITAKAGFTDDSVELKSVTVEVTKTPVTTAAPEPEDDVEQIKKASNAAAAASADAEAQKTAALGNANEATKKAISASAKTEASVEAFLQIPSAQKDGKATPVSTANTGGASTKPAAPVLAPPKKPVSTANTGASTKPAAVTAAPEVVTAAPAVVTAAPITAAPTAVVEMVETT
jgi:hypothetical protein